MGERVRESDGDYVADEVGDVVDALVVVFLPWLKLSFAVLTNGSAPSNINWLIRSIHSNQSIEYWARKIFFKNITKTRQNEVMNDDTLIILYQKNDSEHK